MTELWWRIRSKSKQTRSGLWCVFKSNYTLTNRSVQQEIISSLGPMIVFHLPAIDWNKLSRPTWVRLFLQFTGARELDTRGTFFTWYCVGKWSDQSVYLAYFVSRLNCCIFKLHDGIWWHKCQFVHAEAVGEKDHPSHPSHPSHHHHHYHNRNR